MGRVRFTIYHSRFTRLRTYPQHTLSMLPLLRSRPGGVHKTSVVRSPKSDDSLKHCRLSIVDCGLLYQEPDRQGGPASPSVPSLTVGLLTRLYLDSRMPNARRALHDS